MGLKHILAVVGHIFAVGMLVACSTTATHYESRVSFRVVLSDGGCGTGFPISPTEVLTAWHVVAGYDKTQIMVNGETPSSVAQVRDLDLAILSFHTQQFVPFPIERRPISPGERIWTSGYGVGLHWWSEGLGTTDPNRVSLSIAPGDSGAPIFDEDGDVLAVIVARGRHADHHCWVVPIP